MTTILLQDKLWSSRLTRMRSLIVEREDSTAVSTPPAPALTLSSPGTTATRLSTCQTSSPVSLTDQLLNLQVLNSLVHSHWSRLKEARLSLVESFIVLLRQCLFCDKEYAPRIQSPPLGTFCLLLAGSLWHKDSWLPCTERSYYRHPSWFFMA